MGQPGEKNHKRESFCVCGFKKESLLFKDSLEWRGNYGS